VNRRIGIPAEPHSYSKSYGYGVANASKNWELSAEKLANNSFWTGDYGWNEVKRIED